MDGIVIRDTHKLIAKLQQRGFSAQQAEGITEAIKGDRRGGPRNQGRPAELKVSLIQWMIGIQMAMAQSSSPLWHCCSLGRRRDCGAAPSPPFGHRSLSLW